MKNEKVIPHKSGNKKGITASGIRPITNRDVKQRLLSFFMDVSVMLCPTALWNIILLAVLGNIISISGIFIITFIIAILLVGSILFINSYVYSKTGGQSAGMRLFGFKVVKKNGKSATKSQLFVREIVGFDIPFIILMFFTNILGVIIFWLGNGIVVLLDKRHRSIIDFFTGTCVVLFDKESKAVKKAQVKESVLNTECVNKIDLHIHSNFSANGQYNIEEIFQIAKRRGLKTISITDLDCAKGNAIAVRMSALYNINYVPGIEINCDLHGRRIRVLGYFIQYNSDLYSHIENESLVNEKMASIERVRIFEQLLGKRIDVESLLKSNRFQRISGELVARHVFHHPAYKDCELLKPYLRGSKKEHPYREFNKDFFSYGKSCYVPVKYPLLRDVMDVIEITGGNCVLAHPGKLLSQDPQLIEEALELGIQGIEVFHPMHTRQEMAKLLQIAKERKLFITCGSGFYRTNSNHEMGVTSCPKEAEALVDRFIKAKM